MIQAFQRAWAGGLLSKVRGRGEEFPLIYPLVPISVVAALVPEHLLVVVLPILKQQYLSKFEGLVGLPVAVNCYGKWKFYG